MINSMCYSSPRTTVTHVSSLYIRGEEIKKRLQPYFYIVHKHLRCLCLASHWKNQRRLQGLRNSELVF